MQRIPNSVSLLLYCNNCGNFVLPIAFAVVHFIALFLPQFGLQIRYCETLPRVHMHSLISPGGSRPFPLFALSLNVSAGLFRTNHRRLRWVVPKLPRLGICEPCKSDCCCKTWIREGAVGWWVRTGIR